MIAVLMGMGLGALGLFVSKPKPKSTYVSPYGPGATPPPVPEPSAPFGSPDALRMFSVRDYDAALVSTCAPQIGLYKLQKGFSGYVPPEILDWRKVYPLLTIWERSAESV